jgi:hypothetical protein
VDVGAYEQPGPSRVVGRRVFYERSAFDTDHDDAAIATDKLALLPGQTATAANYTSYLRGLNGVMVDLSNAPLQPTLQDFRFRVGPAGDPSSWKTAPQPEAFTIRAGDKAGSTSRITITWADGVIQSEWLEITVLATSRTGLRASDVFYFGNLPGDTVSGSGSSDAVVNTADVVATRRLATMSGAAIDNPTDHNRDGHLDMLDVLGARTHQLRGRRLQLFTAPPLAEPTQSVVVIAATGARVTGRRRTVYSNQLTV